MNESKKSSKNLPPLFLRGGIVLNVYSGELLKVNVATHGERIWYVGPSTDMSDNDAAVIDVSGKTLVPGYIDPHFHPWLIYNPVSFGEEACCLGTTTLFCDSLIFYMLMGVKVFENFISAFSEMPIKYFWFCRAVPQTPMEEENELFSIRNIKRLLQNPYVRSLGEITRWPDVIEGNPRIMEIIRLTKGLKKRVDGHTAGAKYEQLAILSRAGIESCHEAISAEEALERLRLGFSVMLRESSLRRDLRDLLGIVTENKVFTDRIMLTSDSSTPSFYQEFGITDHLLRLAIGKGIDPILAYRMVTLNPAIYFGMDHEIGGIAPGRYADILVLKDLLHPTPEMVISKGHIVAENGTLSVTFPELNWNRFFPPEIYPGSPWEAENHLFEIRIPGKTIRFPVIKLISPVITRVEWIEFETSGGFIDISERERLSFLTILNRGRKWVTNGIIDGFGTVEGLASTFNTAAEILVIGRNLNAMSAAVNRVLEMKGGIVAVDNGRIAYEFPLPIGGIMSDKPMAEIAKKDLSFLKFLSKRGYPFHDPLYTLVFLPNDFLPEVRINYRGVVDIKRKKVLWPRRDLNA